MSTEQAQESLASPLLLAEEEPTAAPDSAISALALPEPVEATEDNDSESAPQPHGFGIAAAAAPTVSGDVLAALNLHNKYRAAKKVPNLSYDKNLEKDAQNWANHLARNVKKLQHASGTGQGENLYWASGGGSALKGTQAWLDEGKWYTGQKVGEPAKGVIGHYTQCMWSRTTRVGIASAKDDKGGLYVVARYSPPGNYVGQKPY